MKRISCGLAALLLHSVTLSAAMPQQQQPGSSAPTAAANPASATAPPRTAPTFAFGLEEGTPVQLRLTRELSSAVDHTGDKVNFDVINDVKVKDVVVIPAGSRAWATIVDAAPKRHLGRAGKLEVHIDQVRLADGERVDLRATEESHGKGHQGAMAGAMVATSIVFFPAAPLFLFIKGKDIVIPKGTEITAYTNDDYPLDATKFAAATPAQPVPATAVQPQPSAPASTAATAPTPAPDAPPVAATPVPTASSALPPPDAAGSATTANPPPQ
jgi:hypothetical protein